MTFQELLDGLKQLTPEQLKTEVCGFDSCNCVFWASHIKMDNGRPTLQGTDDMGNGKSWR